MTRLASFASLAAIGAAVFTLSGCYNPRYPSDSPGTERTEQAPVRSGVSGSPVMSSGSGGSAYSAGTGVIESIAIASGPGDQLTVRMDNGATQSFRQPSAGFAVGDRVEITSDGRLIRR